MSAARTVAAVDWQTISALATAAGTLVLAVATFSAVRSSNRSAHIAEQSLLTAMRPLLVQSLAADPAQKVVWADRHSVYLAMGLRNVGAGIGLLHGWYPMIERPEAHEPHPEPADFRRLTVDLYIPAGGAGFWEGAVRDPDDGLQAGLHRAIDERRGLTIDLLYGDQQGRQRTISRFSILPVGDAEWYCQAARHWNLDRPDPR